MAEAKRLFTEAELEEMKKDHIMIAREALDKGDIEKARYWLDRNDATKYWIHDHYVHWVTSLFTYIQKNWGDEQVSDAIKETYFLPLLGLEKARKELGVKAYIELWVDALIRHHAMMPGFNIEEDDEKFIFTFGKCGSGGYLIDRGAYGGKFGYGVMKGPSTDTWGEENVPLYCTHCVWVERWSCLLSGEGAQNIVIANRKKLPGEACTLYFYKDASKVPEEYLDRIGMNQTYWHEEPKNK